MRGPNERRGPPCRATLSDSDMLGGKPETEDTLTRAAAQRRLALKLISGTGLSLAFGMAIVALATGEGRPS